MSETLTTRLGLSLRALARLVDTSHSHLSRYQDGTRNLPTPVLIALANLYQLLEQLPATTPAQPDAEAIRELPEKAAWCRMQQKMLQKQLIQMQAQYNQATQLLQLLDAYEGAQEPAGLPENKQRWIAEQRYQAQRRQDQQGWLAQQQLTVRIHLLGEEARLWEECVVINKNV